MLNEVYDLWQACERAGIDLPIRIPGLDEGRNADGIRLFLNEDGAVTRIESVPAAQMKCIRKWSCGSGISLPVFNFEPLHELPERQFKEFEKATRKAAKGEPADLMSFLGRADDTERPPELRWPRTKIGHLDGAFKRVSADLLGKIGGDDAPEGDGWRQLLRTVKKLDANAWLEQLSRPVRQVVREQCFPASLGLLFHNSSKGKTGTVPVQFEMECVRTPVYSARAQSWLKGVLARSETTDENGAHASSVWGMASGSGRKYDQVKLPGLGNVRLFDRNVSEKPASIRYDEEQAIFKVGPDVRMKMMAAVEWLTGEEHKGKTWALRGKAKKEGVFLLLAYLAEGVDNTPQHLAEIFVGPPEEESDRAIIQFETVCTDTVQALDGLPGLSTGARIQVFALHKPDGYRAQVFASESFTQSALRRLAESWQRDCRTHPRIELPQFAQDGGETLVRNFEPLVPFPYQAIECLDTVWEKCEEAADAKCESVSDYSLGDAFELLRRAGADPIHTAYLGRMLDVAIRRALPFMGAVGQAMHQVHRRVFVAQGGKQAALKSRLQARHWPCLLSLLLVRLGYKMEAFVKEPAYLVGRFLAELDLLHAYYAKHVSGKDDGLRQLLGNSLMATALENPLRSLELAGQRMLPYQAWGYSFARGRKLKEALGAASVEAIATNSDRWDVHRILEELGAIAEELSNCAVPEGNRAGLPTRAGHEAKAPTRPVLDLAETLRANDRAWMHSDAAAKAQMLLGYLARSARVESRATAKAEATPAPPDFEPAQPSDIVTANQ
jgi:hypothetical protein